MSNRYLCNAFHILPVSKVLEDVFALLYYEEDILYEYLSRYLVVIDTVYT